MFTTDLNRLYAAYRKAKNEAFRDPNCAHGLKFAKYEANLDRNLRKLVGILNRPGATWFSDSTFIGRLTYIPKSITLANEESYDRTPHFQSSDPLEQWTRQTSDRKAVAAFRPVANASVNCLIFTALWILEIGHLYDGCLDGRYAVGNRLRRWRSDPGSAPGAAGKLNMLSPNLFRPYFRAYSGWRELGLRVMRRELTAKQRIIAVTMDLQRFYHQIDPSFLLDESYLSEIGLSLTSDQRIFTSQIIGICNGFNRMIHGHNHAVHRGLPVGLPISALIANVLLIQFDKTVVAKLNPSYYSRYVDDVFLVLRQAEIFTDGPTLIRWISQRLSPLTEIEPSMGAGLNLKLNLPYAQDSDLRFVGQKQKIFQLEGAHGLDLIGPIEEQIRQQSSEHRDLPHLPDTESRMAHRALLVTSDASLNADALRKADAVTLRRSGFAMLLGDVEAHARDLTPDSWSGLRCQFYLLAQRHLLAPASFFDFYRYFPRILSLMAASNDVTYACQFLDAFKPLLVCLRSTCSGENSTKRDFDRSLQEVTDNLADRIIEAVIAAPITNLAGIQTIVRRVKRAFRSRLPPLSQNAIRVANANLTLLDWGRNSYANQWMQGMVSPRYAGSSENRFARNALRLDAFKMFQRAAGLDTPHWPALAFPTRPISLSQVTTHAPSLLENPEHFLTIARNLCCSWMPEQLTLRLTASSPGRPPRLFVPSESYHSPRIAVTSLEVSDAEWACAADGNPAITLDRYRRINGLLNAVAGARPRPHYIVLPECSLPRRWANQIASRLLVKGISTIAGLEYRIDSRDPSIVYNEVLLALNSNFPGYRRGLFLRQPKRAPAWNERRELADRFNRRLLAPAEWTHGIPVYIHGEFCFGVLVCSELTNISNRQAFQGEVDALFIPEWNRDTESFAALVEASALDVHAYIVQANNRRYGDSRLRAPYRESYRRDVVRVKGGLNDYFVIGEVDFVSLRRFQSNAIPPDSGTAVFKPFPVGFQISPLRRMTPI